MRAAAGHHGERQGTTGNGSDHRSDAARLIGRSISWAACRPQVAQPWAPPHQHVGGPLRRDGTSPSRSAAAISVLAGEPRMSWPARAGSRRGLASRVGGAERPPYGQRRRPGVQAKPCPCSGPRRRGRPVMLGLTKPARAPISSPRSARLAGARSRRARGPARRRGTAIGGGGQHRECWPARALPGNLSVTRGPHR